MFGDAGADSILVPRSRYAQSEIRFNLMAMVRDRKSVAAEQIAELVGVWHPVCIPALGRHSDGDSPCPYV